MDQVEEVKRKTNIVNVVSEHVAIKKKGRNFVGLCPFHSEKSGSFMVNEELQIYKCFGCGAGGDVIKFLMEVEGLSFGEALEKLAEKAGVKLVKKVADGGDKKRELIEIHNIAAEYYHYLLMKHPAGQVARDYLVGRGIGEKLCETFKLGYALPEWEGLTKYMVTKKHYRGEALVAAGLVTGNGNRMFDRFRNRVMFPLLDVAGRVVGFSGRVLPGAKEDEAKYINSPETEIYHKSKMLYGLTVARNTIKKNDRVVLVEGELDMISSFAAGIGETVAIKGSAFTSEMMEILSRLTPNFILSLDADMAGEAAMKRSIEAAEKFGLSIKMVEIVGGKDPDEIARKKPGEWREMVEKAVPIYEFFFDKAVARYGTDSVENIGKIVKEVVPYLAKIENNVIREVWAKRLAERIDVEKARVWEEIEKIRSGRNETEEKSVVVKEPESAKEEMDRQIVGALLSGGEAIIEKTHKLLTGLPLSGAIGKLLALIFEKKKLGRPEAFIRELPEELAELAQEAYLVWNGEDWDEKEYMKVLSDWARRVIKEERTSLAEEIRKEEMRGEEADLGKFSEKLVKLNALERKLVIS